MPVEDRGGQAVLDRIRAQFRDGVAELLWACSDAWEDREASLAPRKEAHIARIANVVDARLILAADKLHNIRSSNPELLGER